jgi:hypothetical protein
MHAISIANRRTSAERLAATYPGARMLDVTSRGPQPWVKFSPFYPHGTIPVPLSPGVVAASVEGIWQGLKVFAHADIDRTAFTNTTMRGLKRTVRSHGAVHGHRAGVDGTTLLTYREARYQIYLPAYRWVLDHCMQVELDLLRQFSEQQPVVLLDYETNSDLDNLAKPLSHAALIIRYLAQQWPDAS